VKLVLLLMAGVGSGLLGCSDDSSARDAGVDSRTDGTSEPDGLPDGPGLTGIVSDSDGEPVQGAEVDVGGTMAYTTDTGSYTILEVTPGETTVNVTQDWFKDASEAVTIKEGEMTTLDITIEAWPLKIEADDEALADQYNQSFDWTQDELSIVALPDPTRKELDNAIYFHNPALYRDTSGEPTLTPSPQPDIASGQAQDFTFPVESASNAEAIDLSTIVDAIGDTPLTAAEQEEWMMWEPMLTWLKDWDLEKAGDLVNVGVAVRQQTWGDASAVRPQGVERVYLHGNELWVEIVFEGFVELGSGVTDSDGDGRVEVFGRVAGDFYTSDVVTALQDEYIQPTYDTHGMSKQINKSLNELYTTTAPEVERYIGESYDIPNVGTIAYPFVVLKHAGGEVNVLLVGP
jgi:hypothetical protein